ERRRPSCHEEDQQGDPEREGEHSETARTNTLEKGHPCLFRNIPNASTHPDRTGHTNRSSENKRPNNLFDVPRLQLGTNNVRQYGRAERRQAQREQNQTELCHNPEDAPHSSVTLKGPDRL